MSTSTVVTISTTARVRVQVESIIEGGRERIQNGETVVEPGADRSFVVQEDQSIRVVDDSAAI